MNLHKNIIKFKKSKYINSTIYNGLIFTIFKYASYAIEIITGIVISKMFGPKIFGIWGIYIIVMQYGQYLHLGTMFYADREVPRLNVSQKYDQSLIVIRNVIVIYFFNIIVLAILSASILPFLSTSIYNLNNILTITGFLSVEFIKKLIYTWLRANKDLKKLAKALIINSAITFVIIILTINEYGILSILFARICGMITVLILVKSCIPVVLGIKTRKYKLLLRMIQHSIGLLLYNISFIVKTTVSRFVVISYLSLTDIGYYSFAYFIYNALLISLDGIYSIVFPKMMEQSEKNIDTTVYSSLLSDVGSVTLFNVSIVSILVMQILIPLLLPEYIPALHPATILVSSLGLSGAGFGQTIILLSKYNEKIIIWINGSIALLLSIMFVVLLKKGYSLTSIAYVEFCMNGLWALIMKFMVLSRKGAGKDLILLVLRPFLKPLIGTAAILLYIEYIYQLNHDMLPFIIVSLFVAISVSIKPMIRILKYVK
jgi:O-antigen/teichoic acid export membrane protein